VTPPTLDGILSVIIGSAVTSFLHEVTKRIEPVVIAISNLFIVSLILHAINVKRKNSVARKMLILLNNKSFNNTR
jgi:predicted Na+-dependent transporter